MPVEIKELIIRARVEEAPPAANPGPAAGGSVRGAEGREADGRAAVSNEQRALVEECVRKTLEILRRERER